MAAVMLCGVLACCGGTQSGSTPASGAQSASAAGDSNVNAEGFPIVNEPITLRGMVALNANVKDWNEHPALKRMEELTGIHIEWECVPDAGFTEKRNLAFASDDLPDIILRAKISPQEEMKYAANGQLVALDEYLDYAPNLSALIEQDDAIRKGITMPDGHIYSCPQLNKTEGNLIHHYWINKTWLDNLGLEAPTTVDELYDVLVAFRDNDPNGNGQKDEIPYCVVGKDYPHRMFYDLLGSWGFGINGVMDDVQPEKYADKTAVYCFTAGKGYVTTDKFARNITELAFFVPDFDNGDFTIHAVEDLEFLCLVLDMTEGDHKNYAACHTTLPIFRSFSETHEYTQDCKGPHTRSWQVLYSGEVGRNLLGVVKAVGEGTVEKGHPAVDQWNYGLDNADFTLTVENESVAHHAGDWSFVPAGLDHSLTAEPGKEVAYIWFERFVKEREA